MENNNTLKKNIRAENSVVYILLPICVDFTYDVFFNALKNVVHRVGRTRLAEYYLDGAFKCGLIAEDILIDEDDITLSWKACTSKLRKIRISKLIGYWATNNCPSMGKVFHGDNWQTPRGNFVKYESNNRTKAMTSAEVDEIVSQKMKCYVVELSVCESTLLNLRQFVKVPISEIDVENPFQITPQMKSFDIKKDFVEKCWNTLKHGQWIVNPDTEIGVPINVTPHRSVASKRMDSEHVRRTNVSGIPLNLIEKASQQNAKRGGALEVSYVSQEEWVTNGPEIDINPVNMTSEMNTSKRARMDESCVEDNDTPLNLVKKPPIRNDVESSGATQKGLNVNPTADEQTTLLQERVHILERQLLEEFQKTNLTLESELSRKKTSLAELEYQLNEVNSDMTEMKKSMDGLRLQLKQKTESLAEIEKDHRDILLELKQKDATISQMERSVIVLNSELGQRTSSLIELQLQLNQKNGDIADMEKSFDCLRSQSKRNSESLAEMEKAHRDVLAAVEITLNQKKISLTELKKENYALQIQLNQKSESMAEMEKSMDDLRQKIESLGEIEKTHKASETESRRKEVELTEAIMEVAVLQTELMEKDQTLTAVSSANSALQLELKKKSESFAEMEKLKIQIQISIEAVAAESNRKTLSLAEIKKENEALHLETRALQLELFEKNEQLAVLEKLMNVETEVNQTVESNTVIGSDTNVETMGIQSVSFAQLPVEKEDVLNDVLPALHPTTSTHTSEELFETDDPIVKACRKKLLALQFGWIKFNKNEKFRPGFRYPSDESGNKLAHEVASDGYPSEDKYEFYQYENDVPEHKKLAAQVRKVKLLNKKFNFQFK